MIKRIAGRQKWYKIAVDLSLIFHGQNSRKRHIPEFLPAHLFFVLSPRTSLHRLSLVLYY